MDGRVVQRLAAVANPQEPRRLLEHLAAQLGDVQQSLPAVKPPVRIAMLDNPLGQLGADPGHVRQQRAAGRVDIDAHRVDARFHFAFQAAAQQCLVHVMLVLADADGLGVDLDQFGQRILQSVRDADRASDRDIQVGILLGGQFAGRIDRRARLADHHLGGRLIAVVLRAEFLQQAADEGVRFPGGRAVADRDQLDVVAGDQVSQRRGGAGDVVAGRRGEDGAAVQELARTVDHGDLASGAKARVDPHRDSRASRRCQQQLAEVLREHLDRFVVRAFLEFLQRGRLGGGQQQALITVLHRRQQLLVKLELAVGAPDAA